MFLQWVVKIPEGRFSGALFMKGPDALLHFRQGTNCLVIIQDLRKRQQPGCDLQPGFRKMFRVQEKPACQEVWWKTVNIIKPGGFHDNKED